MSEYIGQGNVADTNPIAAANRAALQAKEQARLDKLEAERVAKKEAEFEERQRKREEARLEREARLADQIRERTAEFDKALEAERVSGEGCSKQLAGCESGARKRSSRYCAACRRKTEAPHAQKNTAYGWSTRRAQKKKAMGRTAWQAGSKIYIGRCHYPPTSFPFHGDACTALSLLKPQPASIRRTASKGG